MSVELQELHDYVSLIIRFRALPKQKVKNRFGKETG